MRVTETVAKIVEHIAWLATEPMQLRQFKAELVEVEHILQNVRDHIEYKKARQS